MLFQWIRKRTAAAVLEGLQDALGVLDDMTEDKDADGAREAAQRLRDRLREPEALPAPEAGEKGKAATRGRKAG